VLCAGLDQYGLLANVFLQGNNFTGSTLPASWGTSALASSLNVLMINNAMLQGPVPTSWSGLVGALQRQALM
jgi:hypothetical protein